MRLIDPIELKRSIAVSSIIHDGKTLEQIIDEQPTIEPEWAKIDSGTIELELPVDVSQVKRVIVKQKDSHWCGVYYLGGHE